MVFNKITQLTNLLQQELCVDIPLFYNNRSNAARLDFIDLEEAMARNVAKDALRFLFEEHSFWMCAYGSDSGDIFFDNHLLQSPAEVTVLPYHSHVDRDWFEYDHDTMACVEISLETLAIERYLDYVFRLEFLSNTLFLVSAKQQLAVHVYDRRGMDIATRNPLLLARFRKQFHSYFHSLL